MLDFDDRVRRVLAEQHDEIEALRDENEKLRTALVSLVLGVRSELCDERDMEQCNACLMRHDNESCVMTAAMDAAGIDQYGEPSE